MSRKQRLASGDWRRPCPRVEGVTWLCRRAEVAIRCETVGMAHRLSTPGFQQSNRSLRFFVRLSCASRSSLTVYLLFGVHTVLGLPHSRSHTCAAWGGGPVGSQGVAVCSGHVPATTASLAAAAARTLSFVAFNAPPIPDVDPDSDAEVCSSLAMLIFLPF